MRKHILGLMFFGFIVSAAAIVYSFFYVEKTETLKSQYVSDGISACEGKGLREKETGGSTIKQATLSTVSGLFIFEIGCIEFPKQMSLFFYTKQGRNTKLIATEEFYLDITSGCTKGASIYKNFDWAKEINHASNIYVIARSSERKEKFSTKFDESLAVPVLIADNGGFTFD